MQMERTDPDESAQQANLCMEERISRSRQAAYEAVVSSPDDWRMWRAGHDRYVQSEVRRRHPLSAAFGRSEASLRPGIEPNQTVYRVERIDSLLRTYETASEAPLRADQVNEWIRARQSNRSSVSPSERSADVGYALEELTGLFNDERDGRPTFVVFEAEFPGLGTSADWARQFCIRCGLTHFFTDGPVTLALFRYRVQEIIDDWDLPDATLFAVPTVMDQPMSNVYFPAPSSVHGGHAVGLEPKADCSHLAAEMIHASMAYRVHHWVRVDTVNEPCLSPDDIQNLRSAHLDCIRRNPGNVRYGEGCV